MDSCYPSPNLYLLVQSLNFQSLLSLASCSYKLAYWAKKLSERDQCDAQFLSKVVNHQGHLLETHLYNPAKETQYLLEYIYNIILPFIISFVFM